MLTIAGGCSFFSPTYESPFVKHLARIMALLLVGTITLTSILYSPPRLAFIREEQYGAAVSAHLLGRLNILC
jgi:hypothetical protein